jgi:uncharacterized protein YwgA
MNELRQSAILLSLIEHLRSRGGWCGETHIQKTTYFLQELMGVPLDFDFKIYKYGPYSFDLKDTLISMRADSMLGLIPNDPYGATLVPGKLIEQVKNRFPKTLEQFESQITFVANKLSDKKVAELEAISTALFIQQNEEMKSIKRLTQRLLELKPHIKEDFANKAVTELQNIITESQNYRNATQQETV